MFGATHSIVTVEPVTTVLVTIGLSGICPARITAGSEYTLSPNSLLACTTKVYDVPADSPVLVNAKPVIPA